MMRISMPLYEAPSRFAVTAIHRPSGDHAGQPFTAALGNVALVAGSDRASEPSTFTTHNFPPCTNATRRPSGETAGQSGVSRFGSSRRNPRKSAPEIYTPDGPPSLGKPTTISRPSGVKLGAV